MWRAECLEANLLIETLSGEEQGEEEETKHDITFTKSSSCFGKGPNKGQDKGKQGVYWTGGQNDQHSKVCPHERMADIHWSGCGSSKGQKRRHNRQRCWQRMRHEQGHSSWMEQHCITAKGKGKDSHGYCRLLDWRGHGLAQTGMKCKGACKGQT